MLEILLKKELTKEQNQAKTITLDVNGMKCAGCVKSVERQLTQHQGVTSASVNLITSVALVEYEPKQVNPETLAQHLSKRGFESTVRVAENSSTAKLSQISAQKRQQEQKHQFWQLISAALLLLFSSIGHLHHLGFVHLTILSNIWFHWGLATLALLIPGREILQDGWRSLWHFAPNMNTLVGLGTMSAYLASCVALIFPQLGWECFFDEPVMLLGFIFLGRVLESRARGKASQSLEALLSLQPQNARLVGKTNLDNDLGLEIPVEQIKLGEWVRVLAGEKIPVDGKVVQGEACVDESLLTGESNPVTKQVGDPVTSGTINLSGVLVIETTRIGDNTTLNQIISIVEQAQTRKAPIQKLADTVSGYFAYGVITIASVTFLFWYLWGTKIWDDLVLNLHTSPFLLSLKLAISVLVVACPCALGLATPTAILVGTGIGAEKGLLIKGGDVLEKVNQINTIVFDKTGTLTQGSPQVTDLIPLTNLTPQNLLQIAASVEKGSNHPFAQAILKEAQKFELSLLPFTDFVTAHGRGISAQLQWEIGIGHSAFGIGKTEPQIQNTYCLMPNLPTPYSPLPTPPITIYLGNESWLREQGITIKPEIAIISENLQKEGKTVIYLALNQNLLGLIALADLLRPSALPTVTALHELGLQTILLSGDQPIIAQTIAHHLSINTYYGGVHPQEKSAIITALQAQEPRQTVAMVGDGVNDAIALIQADLGIAMRRGAEVSIEGAGIVLMRDNLFDLVEAIKLSKAVVSKIRQNLAWAFAYNIIAIPIAGGFLLPWFGVLLNPPLAGALMAFSSIMVVTNSLLLRYQLRV
jgi:Cu2+-exporting ATPase